MKSSKVFFCVYFFLLTFNVWIFGTSDLPTHWISNDQSIFYSAPVFDVQTTEPLVEKIHWQISNTPEFDWVSPDLRKVSNPTDEIILSKKAQKSLMPGETYYFRFKTEALYQCTPWSDPFSFSVGAPSVNFKEYGWKKSAFVSEASWQNLKPYLLPSNHPVKAKLDSIFSKSRAIANEQLMKKAGFDLLDVWKWDKVSVARHPQLKGFLIKVYFDDHLFMDDNALVNRIIGAEKLRNAIIAHGLQAYFKVPRKWLYQLPDNPGASPGAKRKNFILVVEDMNVVGKQRNQEMFHQSISENHLAGLYYLINTLGLSDSIYINNIPFSKDKKIAFVDTERHNLWPISYKLLTPNLSSKMKSYWKKLTGT